jgi:hypothetical protein
MATTAYNERNYTIEPLEDEEGNLYSPNPNVTTYNGQPIPYRSPSDPSIVKFDADRSEGAPPPPPPPDLTMTPADTSARDAQIAAELAAAQGRTAPQATGATVAPVERVTASQANQTTLAPVVTAGDVRIGATSPTRIAQVGPAATAADSAFRGGQQDVSSYLGSLMRGENSVAALQGSRALGELIAAQRSMAAGAAGGNRAAAARIAAQNIGRIGADIAGRTLEAQLGERNAASQALGQVLGQARGQDLSLSQFNAGQGNQLGALQAQLAQGAYGQDAAAALQRALAQGQLSGQIGMFNTGQANQAAATQAGLTQQTSLANAQLGQQASLANAGAANAAASQQAGLDQQAGQFNVSAALQQAGLNDRYLADLLGQQLGGMQLDQQGDALAQALKIALMEDATKRYGIDQQVAMNEANQPSLLDQLLSGIVGLGSAAAPAAIAASDVRLKYDVQPIDAVGALEMLCSTNFFGCAA